MVCNLKASKQTMTAFGFFAAEDSDSRVIETVFDLSFSLLSGELRETLEYLAVCGPGPVPLDFLRQLAKNEEMAERLEQLYTYSWCERRESDGERAYELHQLVRGRFENRFQGRFIRLVHDIFIDESVHFSIKEKFYPQLEEALTAASENGDERLIDWLYDLFDFCTYRGFADFYTRLTRRVEALFPGDRRALSAAYGNRALIYRRQGKLSDALALHKKEEQIKEELGDRAGLGRTWWNQGLIYNQKRNYKKQIQLWEKSIQINKEIGIPTEKYEKALAELKKD
jgi:tetratricopeptide (TPR) repeat protein